MQNNIVTEDFKFKILVVRNAPAIRLGTDPGRIAAIADAFNSQEKGMLEIDGRWVNLADIVGVFNEDEYSEHEKKRMGYWKCELGNWHEFGRKCNKRECFLDNHKRYKELIKILEDHQASGCDIPVEKHKDRHEKWHLCEHVREEYNEKMEIEYEVSKFRRED